MAPSNDRDANSSNIDLSGRCALVTGAARRVGRALALARAGADVAVHYQHSREDAERIVALNPVPFAAAYKIGKKAAFTLTKTMALNEAAKGITCNAVSPGTLEDSREKPPSNACRRDATGATRISRTLCSS